MHNDKFIQAQQEAIQSLLRAEMKESILRHFRNEMIEYRLEIGKLRETPIEDMNALQQSLLTQCIAVLNYIYVLLQDIEDDKLDL